MMIIIIIIITSVQLSYVRLSESNKDNIIAIINYNEIICSGILR